MMEKLGDHKLQTAMLALLACLVNPSDSARSAAKIVEARVVLAADATHPGSTLKAAVVAEIASGYHINDNKPTLDYLIPTEVKLEPSKHVKVEKFIYPKGELKQFAFSDTRLSVYEGELVVGAELKVARTVPAGTYTLKGKFSYQACNDHACLPPASVPLELTVKVVRRGVPVKRTEADVFNRVQFE